jgi:hypothetical protein
MSGKTASLNCGNSHKNKVIASRRARGQGIIMLVMLVGLVVIPLIGMVSFEVGRLYLGKQQLLNACDSAALTAVATLAGSDNSNPSLAHQNAKSAALDVFERNLVLGMQLTNSTILAAKPTATPQTGAANVYFEFVDPITLQVQPESSPNGKIVHVYGSFGASPAFGRYLGLSTYMITAMTKGAVPQLDLVLCFDVSGSMDDQTPVTFVKRKWDHAQSTLAYDYPSSSSGPGNGTIYQLVNPPPTGTSVNALPPQNLELANWDNVSGGPFLQFANELTGSGQQGLRALNGPPDQGQPPGNYKPGNSPTFDGQSVFTDLVVNLDGNQKFQGFTYNGYSFPDLSTLVEASRGNLENDSVFKSSKANTAVKQSPRAGYQQAYLSAASAMIQPLKDSQNAASLFVDILNTDTDCHFGFVAFDGTVNSAANGTETWNTEDIDLPYGPSVNYPVPMVALNPTAGISNYVQTKTSINSCVALGSTNIGWSLHQAVQDLKAHKRPGSVRAIVLFTDGEPTDGKPLDSDPSNNARMAAIEARQEGIPVYTIGLAQNPAIVPGETAILNDTNNDPSSGGIAAISGNGASFNLVRNSVEMRLAFEKIARHLVELVAAG